MESFVIFSSLHILPEFKEILLSLSFTVYSLVAVRGLLTGGFSGEAQALKRGTGLKVAADVILAP